MRFILTNVLAAASLITSVSAVPVHGDEVKVVHTTRTDKGQVLDWIYPESQGNVATPPDAPPTSVNGDLVHPLPRDTADHDPATQGPKGTVPILRTSGMSGVNKKLPLPGRNADPEIPDPVTSRAVSYAGTHWYAKTNMIVDNKGTVGNISTFSPYVQNAEDFSLIQTAVVYYDEATAHQQTLEAGWIVYPSQLKEPHLFTFYTTNSYARNGDRLGGWNRDQVGWVQVDKHIYPGMPLSTLSVVGGAQHNVQVGYRLKDGNWWLWCRNKYVGYYPASLFGSASNKNSLASGSNQLAWFGEVYQSEAEMTTTDMGSGEFAGAGAGRAAYVKNLIYYDAEDKLKLYNPQSSVSDDKSRYTIDPHYKTKQNGSYFYLGGPGAGGRVGA